MTRGTVSVVRWGMTTRAMLAAAHEQDEEKEGEHDDGDGAEHLDPARGASRRAGLASEKVVVRVLKGHGSRQASLQDTVSISHPMCPHPYGAYT